MSRKDINFNAGFNGCNDKVAILKNEVLFKDLEEYEDTRNDSEVSYEDSYIFVDQQGNPTKMPLTEVMSGIPLEEIQSDWAETDEHKFSYIKNKPEDKTVLDEDMISLYNIGGIYAGQEFKKGTLILDIIKELFSSGGKDNIVKVFVTDFDPSDITPDIIDEIEPKYVPDGIYEQKIFHLTSTELVTKGLVWKNDDGSDISLDNQYYMLAVPASFGVVVNDIFQAGFPISYEVTKVRGPNGDLLWLLYHDSNRVTGEYTFRYTFREGDIG